VRKVNDNHSGGMYRQYHLIRFNEKCKRAKIKWSSKYRNTGKYRTSIQHQTWMWV